LVNAFNGDVEVWDLDGALEWRLGVLRVDDASSTLILNLCEWATLNVGPAATVVLQAPNGDFTLESKGRTLPGRYLELGFPVEETDVSGPGLSIQVEFESKLDGISVGSISRMLMPWLSSLVQGGFAPLDLPAWQSEVRPATPPIIVIDNLWCWRFDKFNARYEAVDVFLNCLERVHCSTLRINSVVVE
jgi:hypothetical protein